MNTLKNLIWDNLNGATLPDLLNLLFQFVLAFAMGGLVWSFTRNKAEDAVHRYLPLKTALAAVLISFIKMYIALALLLAVFAFFFRSAVKIEKPVAVMSFLFLVFIAVGVGSGNGILAGIILLPSVLIYSLMNRFDK
ncbi:MAG: hypothetical protein ACK4K0_08160 [Flavobacteriales bacterium]